VIKPLKYADYVDRITKLMSIGVQNDYQPTNKMYGIVNKSIDLVVTNFGRKNGKLITKGVVWMLIFFKQ
jgi:hypothetical protein